MLAESGIFLGIEIQASKQLLQLTQGAVHTFGTHTTSSSTGYANTIAYTARSEKQLQMQHTY
jgi:hypothetical protein